MVCVSQAIPRRAAGLIAVALLIIATLGWPAAESAAQPPLGPLFLAGLGRAHNCSASVLASASRDLVITAAHCLSGSGAGVRFVPGYRDGRAPYGVWTATQAYVDPAWTADQDPRHDVAILKLLRQQRGGRWVGVQDVVGANQLGTAPADGSRVRVPAYPMGLDDAPISCETSLYWTGGYASFDCAGYVGGTSGAPFLLPSSPASQTGPTSQTGPASRTEPTSQTGAAVAGSGGEVVVGVIGGLRQGGCSDDTSYSSAFGPEVYQLRQRATAGLAPDVLPRPDGSGC